MPYVGNAEDKSAFYAAERKLLLAGFSYLEISQQTGERQMTISERNRLIHKIDIWNAFSRRCTREGFPTRMPTDADFCRWFVGFFDGEGSIVAFTRPCTRRPQYSEFRLGVRIQIREDDRSTIEEIANKLMCGAISVHRPSTRSAMRSVSWRCEKIQDIMEVIIPVFDTFSLRTKKAREYALWRPLVVQRYIDTLGGRSNRKGVKKEYAATFQKTIKAFGKIRHPGRKAIA